MIHNWFVGFSKEDFEGNTSSCRGYHPHLQLLVSQIYIYLLVNVRHHVFAGFLIS